MECQLYLFSNPTQNKPQTLAVKRKAESEEERDESSAPPILLPVKSSPMAENSKVTEDKGSLGGEENRGELSALCTAIG